MLYIVATPIGNLEDISERTRRVFAEAEYICAEDTRKTGQLIKRLGLPKKRFISFYEHNEQKRVGEIGEKLRQGATVVLVSNAGTPGISDPGYTLASFCRGEDLPFTAVPGACAAVNALVLSGLPTDSFYFLGFLPRKKTQRRHALAKAGTAETTLVIYESPFRVGKLLADIREVLGNKKVAVTREMTKQYEEVVAGTVDEVREQIASRTLKGEVTVVVNNRPEKDGSGIAIIKTYDKVKRHD